MISGMKQEQRLQGLHKRFYSDSSESGHGLFELLLCLPLMLLIIFGGIDLVQYLHNIQVAQTIAREGANEARRVCIRHFPDTYLDHACMFRFLDSVEETLTNSRIMVSIYHIGDSGGVEFLDMVATYDGADITDSEIREDRLEGEFQMVQQAMDMRADDRANLVPQDEFFIAVSEIWYDHEYFSRFAFSSSRGYQASVF